MASRIVLAITEATERTIKRIAAGDVTNEWQLGYTVISNCLERGYITRSANRALKLTPRGKALLQILTPQKRTPTP